MTVSFLRIFLVNHVADTFVLLLVRKKLYPEKNIIRIVAGGWIAAFTYVIWECFHQMLPGRVSTISAILLPGILLAAVFQIRTISLFLQTVKCLMTYSFVLGGSAFFVKRIFSVHFPSLFSGIYLFLIFTDIFMFSGRNKRFPQAENDHFYSVEIRRGSLRVECTGLYDSGNLLISQITGEGICVITKRDGYKLMEEKEITDSEKCIFFNHDLYPITYHSVGRQKGVMPGILVDHIVVRKNREVLVDKRGMVGICKERLSKDERFSVLLPEDIFS